MYIVQFIQAYSCPDINLKPISQSPSNSISLLLSSCLLAHFHAGWEVTRPRCMPGRALKPYRAVLLWIMLTEFWKCPDRGEGAGGGKVQSSNSAQNNDIGAQSYCAPRRFSKMGDRPPLSLEHRGRGANSWNNDKFPVYKGLYSMWWDTKVTNMRSRRGRISGKRTLVGLLGFWWVSALAAVRALIRTAGGHWSVTCLYINALGSAMSIGQCSGLDCASDIELKSGKW